jgi:hypothetical protein
LICVLLKLFELSDDVVESPDSACHKFVSNKLR